MSRLIIFFYVLKVVCAGGNSYSEDILPISSTLGENTIISEENLQLIQDNKSANDLIKSSSDSSIKITEIVENFARLDSDEDFSTQNTTLNLDNYDDSPRESIRKHILRGRFHRSKSSSESEQKAVAKLDDDDKMDVEDSPSEEPQSSSRKILKRLVARKI